MGVDVGTNFDKKGYDFEKHLRSNLLHIEKPSSFMPCSHIIANCQYNTAYIMRTIDF